MPAARPATLLFAAALATGAASAEPPLVRIAPKTVTLDRRDAKLADVLAAIAGQTGLPIDASGVDPNAPCPAEFDRTPFWSAVEQVAAQTGSRVTLQEQWRKVLLAPRAGPAAPAAVDGPFRVAVRQVQTRTDFDTGKTFAEVTLDIHWEPRFPVFRLDSQPTITAVADDRGSKLSATTARAKTPPTGFHHATTVRIEGVPRAATKLTRLAGSFAVTAAGKMLPFEFKNLTASGPITQQQDGVAVTLRPVRRVDDRWEVRVDLLYPPAQPEFESFESWVTDNRLRLVDPTGRAFETADYDVPEQGRTVAAVYRFPADGPKGLPLGNRKGWSLTYDTPAPLVEFPVAFELTDISLP